MGLKLYELSQNYNNIYDLLDNEDIPIDTIEEALGGIEDNIDEKFDNIAKMVKSLESTILAYKEEEKRLKTKRGYMENKVKWLKDYMLENLTIMDRNYVEGKIFKVRKQKNNPSLSVKNEKLIPKEYLVPQEPKVDTKQILKDLKEGKEINGVEISPESYHIRIR